MTKFQLFQPSQRAGIAEQIAQARQFGLGALGRDKPADPPAASGQPVAATEPAPVVDAVVEPAPVAAAADAAPAASTTFADAAPVVAPDPLADAAKQVAAASDAPVVIAAAPPQVRIELVPELVAEPAAAVQRVPIRVVTPAVPNVEVTVAAPAVPAPEVPATPVPDPAPAPVVEVPAAPVVEVPAAPVVEVPAAPVVDVPAPVEPGQGFRQWTASDFGDRISAALSRYQPGVAAPATPAVVAETTPAVVADVAAPPAAVVAEAPVRTSRFDRLMEEGAGALSVARGTRPAPAAPAVASTTAAVSSAAAEVAEHVADDVVEAAVHGGGTLADGLLALARQATRL